MRRILVGVDGSKGSQHALAWALDEAQHHGQLVEVVHVVPHTDLPMYVVGRAGGEAGATPQQRRQHGEDVLDDVISAAVPPPSVGLRRTVILADDAAEALVQHATVDSLLVVGSRGLSGLRGLLLGSVSRHCATHAPCPVVVVPGEPRG
jgi:nucleotide-binding universal stress UspA family protein